MLINHSHKTIDQITDINGNPLYGERLMFKRIMDDCESSSLLWHVFYNLGIERPINGKPRFEIDFLLICVKGIVIVEVKGGKVEKRGDVYYTHAQGHSRTIDDPFHQAEQYKWGLFNNDIFSKEEIVIATACAFPMTVWPESDLSDRLWTKEEHDNEHVSFADFCVRVIEDEKKRISEKYPELRPRQLTNAELERLINRRLTSSVFTSGKYSSKEIDEVLDWLRADDETLIVSLSDNNRLFFEGGPGTGKTTIAKTYIKQHHLQHGLYLCWNNMLAAKFRYKKEVEDLGDCDVFTYGAFVHKVSGGRINLDDIDLLGDDSAVRSSFREVLRTYLDSPGYRPYDYVIVDEIHDVLDKGIDILIDECSSVLGEGLRIGRFLAFYDKEQGFMNEARDLSQYASKISYHTARYRLLDCRRVQTNRDIIEFARRVKDAASYEAAMSVFREIELTPGLPISIKRFDDSAAIMQHVKQLSEEVKSHMAGNYNVLLTHSNVKNAYVFGGMPLLNGIRQFAGTSPLTKDNINEDFANRFPTANILEYKGLESRNVTLLLYCKGYFDTFELYIGMTRAIQSLTVLILDSHE